MMETLKVILEVLLAISLLCAIVYYLAWLYERGRQEGIRYAINRVCNGKPISDGSGKRYEFRAYEIKDE